MSSWVLAHLQPQRLFYGWYIALAGAGSNFFILGVAVIAFGVFIEPVRQEFGWSASVIALGFSIRSFEQGFMSPITGYLVDRFGPRRMAVTGVIILTVGLFLFSQTQEIWLYYVAVVIIAMGQSLGAMNPFSLALVNWFQRKRGRALGLLNTGNACGYLMAPIMAVLVVTFGWRETLSIAAVVIFAVGIPLAMVIRTRPEPYGYLPDGEGHQAMNLEPASLASGVQPSHRQAISGTGMTVGEALRTPTFYLLAWASALGGSAHIAWVIFQIPHLETAGFSVAATGLIVGIYGGAQIVLRFSIGWLGDIIGRRQLYVGGFLLQAIGLLIFAKVSPSLVWLLPFYYLTFALGHAAWLIGNMTIIADYFGTKRYATIRGLSATLRMPAGMVGPLFVGWMFDMNGSYDLAFMLLAGVCALSSFFLLLIRRPNWSEAES